MAQRRAWQRAGEIVKKGVAHSNCRLGAFSMASDKKGGHGSLFFPGHVRG